MYTLMIVDDEPLAQVGLKSMLDWQALDISVIGTSPNGLHAFEAILRHRPDIVITDIRMPMLDGIGLLERCRSELDYSPEFIVLTGYADFESARRSLRCSVVDFLVKLELDEATLRSSVEKAKAVVSGKRKAGFPAGRAAAAGDPFAETALTRLLEGSFADSSSARDSLAKGGIDIAPGVYRVAFFKVAYPNAERLSAEERLRAYWCVVDMIVELVDREARALVVPFDDSGFAALVCFPPPPAPASLPAPAGIEADRAALVVERARDMAEKFFGVELLVGIGSPQASLERAAVSYREAVQAVSAAGADRPVLSWAELRGSAGAAGATARPDGTLRRAAVAKAVASVSSEDFRAIVELALGELDLSDASAPEALALCCEILYPILERQEDGEALLDSFFPDESEGYRCLFSVQSSERMRAWLAAVRDGLCARFDTIRARGNNPLVAGVRAYVQQNYSEKLVLADVARRFRVSPNHLSSVFKKYNGEGFSAFVAKVKADKAKELIRDGRYKMFEVAQLLGFDDAFYFSKVFKKVTGMSPREFYLAAGGREPSALPTAPPEEPPMAPPGGARS